MQGECYVLAMKHMGREHDRIEYRLITRPTLRMSEPKHTWAVKRANAKRAMKVCDTEGEAQDLACAQGAGVEHRVAGDADRDAFEARCFEWLMDEPFRLVSHTHFVTESRLNLARQWLWESCKRILNCRSRDCWLPNAEACYTYGRECEYMPLCEAIADGMDIGGVKRELFESANPHPELGELAEQDKGRVTFSSLSKLALCEVRYYWRQEACLRRRVEDSEALWTGGAMHAGMEALANEGLDAGLAAVDKWADANPIIGDDAFKRQEQQVARAQAMVRAGALKWKG